MRLRTVHIRDVAVTSIPRVKSAHIHIEQLGHGGRITVQPFRTRQQYSMPLAEIAALVVYRVAKLKADEARKLKAARRKERRH